MNMLSNILSCSNTKPNMFGFIKPPVPPQNSDIFKNAIGLYDRRRRLNLSQLLSVNVLTPVVEAKPAKKITLLGSRFSCIQPFSASSVALRSKTTSHFSHIEESKQQVETLVDKVVKLNLQFITSLGDIPPMEPIEEAQNNEKVEAPVPLNLVHRITAEIDLQATLLPVSPPTPANVIPSNTSPLDEPIQSSREEKLIRWILTSHNMYGLAVTVLHNFVDICCQKPEERNFINDSLVPRIRYTGFTFSATAGVVYHVAIGVLFTPLVAATLGQKKEINEIWYGYWAGASISAMGVFAGIFGMVSGNYLIHKTMERSVPQFKRLLTRYLYRAQIFCTRLNGINFPQLQQEVENVNTTAEMISITRKLVGIARNLLPAMVLQSRF